jgi:AcrR family transcriptional regulator
MRKGKSRVRIGRPPRAHAGEVEARILDAAQRVFFERGLGGASIDEIAGLARAGKPTIYCRFPNKEALFTAVVMRDVEAHIAAFESPSPSGATSEERLANLGAAVVHEVLAGGTVGLMRMAVAEAQRFPHLASSVRTMARRRGAEVVGRLLLEIAESDELGRRPAFAPGRLEQTAERFLDLVLAPLLMRALFGERISDLQTEIRPHVTRIVPFFLAACRHADGG